MCSENVFKALFEPLHTVVGLRVVKGSHEMFDPPLHYEGSKVSCNELGFSRQRRSRGRTSSGDLMLSGLEVGHHKRVLMLGNALKLSAHVN